MNKYFIFLILLLTFESFSQKESPSLKNFQKKFSYQKSKNYKGPEDTYYETPADMSPQENNNNPNSSGNNGTINYSPQEIEKKRSKNHHSGKGGNKPDNPKMGKPEPIEFDPPEIDSPDIDLPDIDTPSISLNFWKILLIIILAIGLIFLIYYLVKNYSPKNKKVIKPITPDDWNPDLITKSELELRLEEALKRNDFRECVRIYFTFILKEMIRLNLIKWKKDFTNYDYVLQVKSHKISPEFEESVRIYDLVWYGEYNIQKEEYTQLSIHLEQNYKQLEKQNA